MPDVFELPMFNGDRKAILFPLTVVLLLLVRQNDSRAQVDRFTIQEEDKTLEVWRITNDPTVRDHANYHNTQCWSPDGRYLCYTHYAADDKEFGTFRAAEIHLFDLHLAKDVRIDQGTDPRWANNHSWLFYAHTDQSSDTESQKGRQILWYDVARRTKTRLADDVERLKATDCGDRWLYGIRHLNSGERRCIRIPIQTDAESIILPPGEKKDSWYVLPNPAHPVIVSYDGHFRDYCYATKGTHDIPFVARHFFDQDLDMRNRTESLPIMEGTHFSWDGGGSYFLAGNGPMRGRKWNEPFPSNLHFLSTIRVGDICPCGRSGRWICGSTGGGRGPLRLADTRSGDGWTVMKTHSIICFQGTGDNSGAYDIDAKGSPDGTKIAFVSTYDLKDGPATEVTEEVQGDQIVVESTDGFPAQGRLVQVAGFRREVIGYERKTATSFVEISRGLYGTPFDAIIPKGQTLTSFESRLIPEELREDLPLPSRSIRAIIEDANSPLRLQRSSDLYVVVVRSPDPPHLRRVENIVELIPGENHWETRGYHLFKDGKKITSQLFQPGESLPLNESGIYTAMAVEYSGLEGRISHPLAVQTEATLKVLEETPADFSWTRQRYVVGDHEISREEAMSSVKSIREIVHLHDGTIHREWLRQGSIVKRVDLNAQGKPIRRLFYEEGRLARREYHDRNNMLVSTEHFDAEGYITESTRYSGTSMDTHWEYEHGNPIKCSNPSGVYEKMNDRWIKTQSTVR